MSIETGVIISEAQPSFPLATFLWGKPTPTTVEWYEVHNGIATLVSTEPVSWEDAIADHAALPDAHHPANVGITGTKTLGGFKFTFTNGLLTGFEPV